MSAGGGSRDGGFRQWLVLAWGPCGAHPCPKTHLALCFLPLVCFSSFSLLPIKIPRECFLVLLSSFYLKYIFLLKYILGNTFWEIHFEKHIVRVHRAEIQHCYLREAKTFEQTTLGKKHLAKNVWQKKHLSKQHLAKRNVFHYLPCMMRIQSGIRIKQGRFTSGGV